jgi:CheY-like chemotaxis protein
VAYAIMKKHDGLITVDSAPDSGTTFSLYLPAVEFQDEEAEEQQRQEPSSGGSILIMDDEELVRDIAGEMLDYLGYTTRSASDGEQALLLYQEALQAGRAFDVVLMDLTIPGGMGGKETMTRLLEIDPNAQGIVSSGYANDPIMANFADFGFSGVVPKPYQLDELRTSFAQLISPDNGQLHDKDGTSPLV